MAALQPTKNKTNVRALSGPACSAAVSGCQTGSLGKMGERQMGVVVADSYERTHPHPGTGRRGSEKWERGEEKRMREGEGRCEGGMREEQKWGTEKRR